MMSSDYIIKNILFCVTFHTHESVQTFSRICLQANAIQFPAFHLSYTNY